MKYITRGVWILSLISMFNDIASELLYPIMPIYLKSIGFSVLLIGILEGVAEVTAGLSKGYFGKLSDLSGKRVPFIQSGYFLSSLSKPMMAILTFPFGIFFARTLDRLGKGLRTGARDAMLSDQATPETKGKVFGFHRTLDTLGAVIGPCLALIYLYFYPGNYKTMFFLAFIPGMIAFAISFLLKDKKSSDFRFSVFDFLSMSNPTKIPNPKSKIQNRLFSFLNYWKESPLLYRKVVIGLLVFALFNSSDLFLLLKAKEAGITDTGTIGLYILYNISFALFAFPFGSLADKFGLNKVFIAGLLLFAVVYFVMAANTSPFIFIILFIIYGLYAAATEGISKAWISNITDKKDTATAIGTFTGFQSLCAMSASALTGLIWYKFGGQAAFMMTAIVTLAVVFYFLFLSRIYKI